MVLIIQNTTCTLIFWLHAFLLELRVFSKHILNGIQPNNLFSPLILFFEGNFPPEDFTRTGSLEKFMDHIKSGLEYGVAMDKIADSVLLDAYSEICNILDTRV
jgi:hypothetical protein